MLMVTQGCFACPSLAQRLAFSVPQHRIHSRISTKNVRARHAPLYPTNMPSNYTLSRSINDSPLIVILSSMAMNRGTPRKRFHADYWQSVAFLCAPREDWPVHQLLAPCMYSVLIGHDKSIHTHLVVKVTGQCFHEYRMPW